MLTTTAGMTHVDQDGDMDMTPQNTSFDSAGPSGYETPVGHPVPAAPYPVAPGGDQMPIQPLTETASRHPWPAPGHSRLHVKDRDRDRKSVV